MTREFELLLNTTRDSLDAVAVCSSSDRIRELLQGAVYEITELTRILDAIEEQNKMAGNAS